MVAIGKAIEPYEKKASKERLKESGKEGGHLAGRGRPKQKGSGKLPDPFQKPKDSPKQVKGDSRDAIANAAGVNGRTYEKAKDVVEAAQAPAVHTRVHTLVTETVPAHPR
jgi:hypothetical protein